MAGPPPRPIPRPYRLALDTAQHRAEQILKQAQRDTAARLARAGIRGDGEFTTSQWRAARRITLQAQNNVWRNIQRTVGMNRYDAAAASVNLQDLAPVIRAEVLAKLESAQPSFVDISQTIRGAMGTTEGWMNSMLTNQLGNTGAEALKAITDWINPDVTGGLSYAVDRLTQDQMSDSFHESQIETADVRGIQTVFWRLDPGHETEDECDDYADQEFNVDDVPEIPHLGCLCWLEEGQTTEPDESSAAYDNTVGADQVQGDHANRLTFEEMNQAEIKGAQEISISKAPDAVQGWAEYLRSSAGPDATVRVMQTPSGGYTYHVFK